MYNSWAWFLKIIYNFVLITINIYKYTYLSRTYYLLFYFNNGEHKFTKQLNVYIFKCIIYLFFLLAKVSTEFPLSDIYCNFMLIVKYFSHMLVVVLVSIINNVKTQSILNAMYCTHDICLFRSFCNILRVSHLSSP